MGKLAKSEWMAVSVDGDRSQAAVKSWFAPLCDDMTVEKAEVLCDVETDREKKIRAFVVDKSGKRHIATRTRGGKTFNISLKAA
jgi:hypothetical protein